MGQYLTGSTRNIVDRKIAEAWLKVPEGWYESLYPLVSRNDIYQSGYFVTEKDSGFLNFCKKLKLKPSSFKKAVLKQGKTSIPYGRCQVTGEYVPVNMLEWRRVYNKKVYCLDLAAQGFIWLTDKHQFIKDNETRITAVQWKGTKVYWASSSDWIGNNIDLVESSIEPGYIDRDESRTVRLTGGAETRISKYEYEHQLHGEYYLCDTCERVCSSHVDADGDTCQYCLDRRAGIRVSSNIYNYSHRVEKSLGFDSEGCTVIGKVRETKDKKAKIANVVYLGTELEYNIHEKDRPKSVEWIHGQGYALCKSDASVKGYEIVSKPCSISTHRKEITLMLDKWAKVFDPGINCGLHVHISRSPFTNGEIGKVLGFLHREANREFITGMAGRTSDRYAKFTDSYIKEQKRQDGAIARTVAGKSVPTYDVHLKSRERMTALNVKDETLEFRIFANSTDPNTVMARIQFCEALFMYAHDHSFNHSRVTTSLTEWMNVRNFIKFVNEQKDRTLVETTPEGKPVYAFRQKYPELMGYFVANKLVVESKNMKDVWLQKILKSFDDRIMPTEKHRECPKRIKNELAEQLSKNQALMAHWIGDRNNYVIFSKEQQRWELHTYTGALLMHHTETKVETKETVAA